MTQLLQQACSEIQKLPEPDQDAIAAIILDELQDERRWEEAFANSQEKLCVWPSECAAIFALAVFGTWGSTNFEFPRYGRVRRSFSALPDSVKAKVRKAYRLWRLDPSHPGLHFKRVHSREPLYSALFRG